VQSACLLYQMGNRGLDTAWVFILWRRPEGKWRLLWPATGNPCRRVPRIVRDNGGALQTASFQEEGAVRPHPHSGCCLCLTGLVIGKTIFRAQASVE